jgi:hypothetical protein
MEEDSRATLTAEQVNRVAIEGPKLGGSELEEVQ